jgi:predicted permease
MRAYQALLRLVPASFRAEYGGEMSAIFAQRWRDARGPLACLVLWLDAFVDVVSSALRVHADILLQDLRYVGRTLGRSPGFAATVTLVTALGVGATTAAFTITDHVLVRPLPFPEPHRLVQLWQNQVFRGYSRVELSPANYRDWQRMSTSFEAMAAFHSLSVNMVGEGDPERLEGASVTAELMPLLGTPPFLGRVFAPEDDEDGASGTLVLSHGLWQGRFGGDPRVLGRKVILDDAPYEVIGVMPPAFHFPRREVQLWTAKQFAADEFERRNDLYLLAVARLKHGVSLEEAQAEMQLVAAQLEREYPKENGQTSATVVSLRDQLSRQARLLLTALFGAALCVLLIACTNLASLFLARAMQRRKEISVRAALGAGRERLVRQLLTESMLLAAAGGALGVLLAVGALPLVVRLVPNSLPISETPALDLRVLAFAALMTVVTAIGFGLVPALRVFRDADAAGLREGSRSGIGRKERLRSGLVVAEVTVSVVLLISSGLLIRALLRLQTVDPGFRSEGVLTLRTSLPMPKYEQTARRAQFYSSVLEDARALPGVTGAAYISFLPMVMRGGIWGIEAEGNPVGTGDSSTASIRYVTPGFFATLGIPVRRGRDVSEEDREGTLSAAVVSESFVARYWPGQDPIGRRFRFGLLGGSSLTVLGPFQDRTVVGVVGDIKVRGVERTSEPQVYLPCRQQPDGAMSWYTPQDLVVKSNTDPASLVPALRKIIARADPAQPISDVRTLSAIVEAETAPRKVQVRVLGAFAALALLLAGIGIHGLLAFTVSNRAQEIGVRMALGARRSDILSLVLRHGLVLGAVGVALGLALALAAGRGLEALLAGVSPRDAATFLTATGVAVSMALLGSLLPAIRAIRVDPLTVMRAE